LPAIFQQENFGATQVETKKNQIYLPWPDPGRDHYTMLSPEPFQPLPIKPTQVNPKRVGGEGMQANKHKSKRLD
jgi:hypothetical protein